MDAVHESMPDNKWAMVVTLWLHTWFLLTVQEFKTGCTVCASVSTPLVVLVTKYTHVNAINHTTWH